MPSAVSLYLIAVWFCVGFFTGCGWGLGLWLVGKLTALIERGAAKPV